MKIVILFACVASLGACADGDGGTDLIIIDQVEGSNFYINSDSGKSGVFSSGNDAVRRSFEKANNSCQYAVFSANVRARNSDSDIYDISIDQVISSRGLTSSEMAQAEKAINGLPYKAGKICFPLGRVDKLAHPQAD